MTPESSDEFGQVEQQIGSTDAQPGEGRPRLIFGVGSENWDGAQPREFDLLDSITTIGSGPDVDLKLEGLAPLHAEIRHDDRDEYVLYIHDAADSKIEPASLAEEAPDSGKRILRTGARVELGGWAMSYYREEFADHGRPFGGRQGGEGETQLGQSGEALNE